MKKKIKKILGLLILGTLVFNKYTLAIILMSYDNFKESRRVVDVYSENSPNSTSFVQIQQTEMQLMPDPNIRITCTNNSTKESIIDIRKGINLSRLWNDDNMIVEIEWRDDEREGILRVYSDDISQYSFDPITFKCN